MGQERYKFIRSKHTLDLIKELKNEGKIPTCPICGVDLIVALDDEEASLKGVYKGVHCPKNPKHVSNTVNKIKGDDFWDDVIEK